MRLSFKQSYEKNQPFINSKSFQKIRHTILIPTTIIAMFGMLMLYSAGEGLFPWCIKQLIYFSIFTVFAIFLAHINTIVLRKSAYIFYALSIGLLLFVILFGHVSMGARRWIDLKIIKLQPSEIAKVAIILAFARIFENIKPVRKIFDKRLLIIAGLTMLPFSLIVLQPDLATGLILTLLSITICFACGINSKIFLGGIVTIICASPLLFLFLHGYQKNRILNFLNPDRDPLGSGYNINQSKIAVGSGGLFGKGITQGSQSHLGFLPENQTDFIFTMFAEETGLFGCIIAIICYIYIMQYGIRVSLEAKSIFCKVIALGGSSLIFLHWFVNLCMITGMLPAAG
ncbi:rod shape-determining protein RodA, partial [Rickettsiales bacterium]|nr:rod shape-determining protein RodA [Rickettsiales bacterium]